MRTKWTKSSALQYVLLSFRSGKFKILQHLYLEIAFQVNKESSLVLQKA